MKLITRESDYGISALVSLAKRQTTPTSTLELARELRIPRSFLRRLLQKLVRSGMIRSRKGIGGGFELATNPKQISVGDVVTALQGAIQLGNCDVRGTVCARRGSCVLRKKLSMAEGRLISDLTGVSIASLVE